jgi:hypothetical protein
MNVRQTRARPKAGYSIRQIYDGVEFVLWTLLAVFCLYFAFFIAPELPKMQARLAAEQALEVASEHERLCSQLGKIPGTREHEICLLDVQGFRAAVERRLGDAMSF